ncbi:MAG: type II toxin-antitoxin system HicA family toxin [Capsulimonadaceae bacterium]
MGKLRILSGREVCSIFASEGFEEREQNGSHIPMRRTFGGTSITVSVPNHKELAIGTLCSIIRRSGVPRELFEEK